MTTVSDVGLRAVEARVHGVLKPLRTVLSPEILRKVAIAEITLWATAQDESVDSARIVATMNLAIDQVAGWVSLDDASAPSPRRPGP